MKKEALIAIALGFTLGIIITFGIWTANKALNSSPQEKIETPSPTITILEEEKTKLTLEISSPENNIISQEPTISLKGNTSLPATVVILYEGGEIIVETDLQGRFESEIELLGGYNEIQVTALTDEEEVRADLQIIYSTAKI